MNNFCQLIDQNTLKMIFKAEPLQLPSHLLPLLKIEIQTKRTGAPPLTPPCLSSPSIQMHKKSSSIYLS